jgi:aminopeptidase
MAADTLTDATRSKVAQSILKKNLAVKRGERVIIEAWTHTLPWTVALAREARRIGALPLMLYEDEGAYWDSVEAGEAKRLGTLGEHEWAAIREADVYIHMWGPGDRVRVSTLPKAAQDGLFAWNDQWYKEARKAGLRGARLDLGRPYPSMARVYGVDEETWTQQLVRATMVDPKEMQRNAAPIAQALAKGKRLRIRHSNGTDLTVGLAHRPVRQLFGTVPPPAKRGPFDMLTNIPAGMVSVALDESVADGTMVANRTDYYDDGTATGATFHFANGRLTEATFETGEEHFTKDYSKAGKGRDQPGMLRIGLNPELRNTPQLEDTERGATMVSVGGNAFIGGKNKANFFGFAITAGADLEIDGKPLSI